MRETGTAEARNKRHPVPFEECLPKKGGHAEPGADTQKIHESSVNP